MDGLADGQLDDWEILTELSCRLAARRHGKLSKQYLAAVASKKAGPERVLDLLDGLNDNGLTLIVVALARPQRGLEEFKVHTEGIDIVVCIDRDIACAGSLPSFLSLLCCVWGDNSFCCNHIVPNTRIGNI